MKYRKINFAHILFALVVLFGAQQLAAYASRDLQHPNQHIKNEQLMCHLIEQGKAPERSQRGCCSHHGGVLGCAKNGITVCRDCTYSPSCHCF